MPEASAAAISCWWFRLVCGDDVDDEWWPKSDAGKLKPPLTVDVELLLLVLRGVVLVLLLLLFKFKDDEEEDDDDEEEDDDEDDVDDDDRLAGLATVDDARLPFWGDDEMPFVIMVLLIKLADEDEPPHESSIFL